MLALETTIICGDSLSELACLKQNSIDAVVTDPPYGLSFMGKRWDYDVPSIELWQQVLRVLKPGGHLLCFAGSRTYHRMVCRIEDAGFEIRDCIQWIYGSGFPKSHNLKGEHQGWGTALKPAYEPICVARKPLIGTVANNVMQYGTGAINIDACRVGEQQGRWPANVMHDGSDEVLALFPDSKGQQGETKGTEPSHTGDENTSCYGEYKRVPSMKRGDTGSAARFFYCAKASKKDRDEGLDIFDAVTKSNGNKWSDQDYRVTRGDRPPCAQSKPRRNVHPTVKPTDLMRYLCRLVTPRGGLILDPFTGSGSTGKAATLEGFNFVGIEREQEYCNIATARIEHARTRNDTTY